MSRLFTRLLTLPRPGRCLLSRPTPKPTSQFLINKKWAHNFPLTYDFARERIMLVLRLFDKIDGEKLTLDSHFYHDLGLDSLDHMEIIMELEDEFEFEIPDRDIEQLVRPSDIVRYITDKEEAYEELQRLQAESHHHDHHDEGHEHGENHAAPQPSVSAGHHSENTSLNPSIRGFCSLTFSSKRNSSDKANYPTSFHEDRPDPISFEEVQERVMKVCSEYDKIDASKLQLSSHFVNELGLDSLDHVEIIMELEEEFGLEIPDQEAEKMHRPTDIAKYIFDKESERRQPVPEDRGF